jgi:hypothetical protein
VILRRLDSGQESTLLQNATDGRYLPSGHLVYGTVDNVMMAARFDIGRLEVTGAPVPVLERVEVKANGSLNASISNNGSMTYVSGAGNPPRRLVWVTRDGRRTPATPGIASIDFARYLRLSPDGLRVALTTGPSFAGQIWVYDLTGSTPPRRLTSRFHSIQPAWTADGRIVLMSLQGSGPALYVVKADGSQLEPDLLVPPLATLPSPHPSLPVMLFTRPASGRATSQDIWQVRLDGEAQPEPWLQTSFSEGNASFSKDGRWVAYSSNVGGTGQIYVRPFPGPGVPVQVTATGGAGPVWSFDGKELFFFNEFTKLFSSRVLSSDGGFRAAPPTLVVERVGEGSPGETRMYDVAPDGRILTFEDVGRAVTETRQVIVVLNWEQELKRLVPTD